MAPQVPGRASRTTSLPGRAARILAVTSSANQPFFRRVEPLSRNCTFSPGWATRAAQWTASLLRRSEARRRMATAISSWREDAASKTTWAREAISALLAVMDHSMSDSGSFICRKATMSAPRRGQSASMSEIVTVERRAWTAISHALPRSPMMWPRPPTLTDAPLRCRPRQQEPVPLS